jgi:dienelactone hydrolase
MTTTTRFLFALGLSFLSIFTAVPGMAQTKSAVGIILLHGYTGLPTGHIAKLTAALRAEGYTVRAPVMPWSRDEAFSASYTECLKIIGTEVQALRSRGIQTIVVGGHSLGAHMAMAYACTDRHLAGVIILAPGHFPEMMPGKHAEVAESVAQAKTLMSQGHLDQKYEFIDINNGSTISIKAKPADYLSFCDPDGPSQLSNALYFRRPYPVLVIAEDGPRFDVKTQIFDVLRKNDKSLFIQSTASHVDVPDKSIQAVSDWLKTIIAP